MAAPDKTPGRRNESDFPISADSPFDDGYDIAAERDALAHLVESDDPDEADPGFDRYLELLRRESILKQRAADTSQRNSADRIVPDNQARALRTIGYLVSDDPDLMTIHTRDAYRLFIGRANAQGADGKRLRAITSGKRVAAALRAIWNLSARDNPYADWVLVQVSERVGELREEIRQESTKLGQVFQREAERGLNLRVMGSQAPVNVELGFRSPYGFMLADVLLDVDYYARQVKTLVQKDRMSDEEGRLTLFEVIRKVRQLFESIAPYQRYLLSDELAPLSRADFLPGSDEQGQKRVFAAREIFGEVPQEIFVGDVRPRHSQRRSFVSAEELALLRRVAAGEIAPAEGELAQEERLV